MTAKRQTRGRRAVEAMSDPKSKTCDDERVILTRSVRVEPADYLAEYPPCSERERQRLVAEAKEKVVEAAMIWYNKAYFNRRCEFLEEVALAKAAAALEAAALGR